MKYRRAPKVGIDLDGTIANTFDPLLKLARREYGVTDTKNSISINGINAAFKSVPHAKVVNMVAQIWSNLETIKLMDHDIPKIISGIRSMGYKVIICTATYGSTDSIIKWMRKNDVGYDGFVQVKDPELKLHQKFLTLIDDSGDIIKKFTTKTRKPAILMKGWWNASDWERLKGSDLIGIANCWNEAMILFNALNPK